MQDLFYDSFVQQLNYNQKLPRRKNDLKNLRVAQSIVFLTGKVAEDPEVEENINDILDGKYDSTFPEGKAQDDNKGQFEVEDEDLVGLMKSEGGKSK